jgi:cell division protein FtsW (lipid II flippase)
MEIAGYPLRRLRARLVVGIDPTLFVLALLLSLLGLGVLYSASIDSPARVANQTANLVVALAAMWLVAIRRLNIFTSRIF